MTKPAPGFTVEEFMEDVRLAHPENEISENCWRMMEIADMMGVSHQTALRNVRRWYGQGRIKVVQKEFKNMAGRWTKVPAYEFLPIEENALPD